MPVYTRNTSLGRLRPHELKPIHDMLDIREEKYKNLASHLKKRNGRDMFSTDEIEGLQLQFVRRSSPSKEIFSRWKFENPNICDLLNTFHKCKLYREAEFILSDILKEPVPSVTEEESEDSDDGTSSLSCPCRYDAPLRSVTSRPQENDETESLDSYDDFTIHSTDSSQSTLPKTVELTAAHPAFRPGVVTQCSYEQLCEWTNNFNDRPYKDGGNVIGSGGFATVYLGTVSEQHVAVKRMKVNPLDSDVYEVQFKQFQQEMTTLATLQHKNLLIMLGYGVEESYYCIVYEYMRNGSLEDRLACKDNTPPLTISQRLSIVKDSAEGIHFLHMHGQVHRDIKSANILLSEDFTAKIGDCGLVKQGPTPDSLQSYIETETITGTKGYIPPEYVEGKVSVKMDAFAFGVVLLEVLTGMPCLDYERRKQRNGEAYLDSGLFGDAGHKVYSLREPAILIPRRHVIENCSKDSDFWQMRDTKCGAWDSPLFLALYKMAQELSQDDRKKRKMICEALEELDELKC